MGQIKGMRQPSIDAVDATKPYKRGTDILWILHKLDILDKHRTVLTVGQVIPSRIVIPFDSDDFLRSGIKLHTLPEPISNLDVGQELFREPLDAKVDQSVLFSFQITFNEPGIIQGESIVQTLQKIIDTANGLIASFDPLFV
jgi:hypothetical protein